MNTTIDTTIDTTSNELKQEIFCTLSIDGIHRWDGCDIPEVIYLKNDHRHQFGIKCYANVSHSDRDIEFIELKHKVLDYLNDKYYCTTKRTHYFGSMSCEMIAIDLVNEFDLSKCEVNEDNENGSVLTVTTKEN